MVFAGIVIEGGVVSTTVITCVAELAFPQASVAVHVLVITLVLPQFGTTVSLCVIVTLPQLSVPVATPVAEEVVLLPHSTLAFAGVTIVGGVVSTTVIVCSPLTEFPQESVAVQVLLMMPVFPQPGVNWSV